MKNSKSIGTTAKIALFLLWIGSFIGIGFIASNAALHHDIEASVSSKEELSISANDTINVKMMKNEEYDHSLYRYHHDYQVEYQENGDIILFSRSVTLIVKSTDSDNARIRINKNAGGISYTRARERAQAIDYNYVFEDNTLKLDGYFLFDPNDKYNQQEIEVILYLPEGAIIFADKNTRSFLRNSTHSGGILGNKEDENHYQVIDDDLKCLDCNESNIQQLKSEKKSSNSITINSDKVDINIKSKEQNVNVKRDSVATDTINN